MFITAQTFIDETPDLVLLGGITETGASVVFTVEHPAGLGIVKLLAAGFHPICQVDPANVYFEVTPLQIARESSPQPPVRPVA